MVLPTSLEVNVKMEFSILQLSLHPVILLSFQPATKLTLVNSL